MGPLAVLLPLLGAAGFAVFSELALREPGQFLQWTVAAVAWIMAVFAMLAVGRLRGRLVAVSVPAVLMIALSTSTSLLFLDLVSPRHGFIVFFALVLWLFLEHVRHEAGSPNAEEKLYIAGFARMVNIGSMFLLATVAIGITIFIHVPYLLALVPLAGITALWSWHLYAACDEHCGRPLARIVVTTLIVGETYVTALRMPTTMFVGGGLIAVVYYLAAILLPIGDTGSIPAGKVKRYAAVGLAMIAVILLTARWN